jgi:hypothetical protein
LGIAPEREGGAIGMGMDIDGVEARYEVFFFFDNHKLVA